MDNRQIAWFDVYQFVAPHLPSQIVLPGTPAWLDLDDTDPLKRRNLLWPVIWWCLEQDARQTALADASRQISTAAPWAALAQRIQNGRGDAFIRRAS